MAEEAYQCFQSLLSHIPTWIADIQHILAETTPLQPQPYTSHESGKPKSIKSLLSSIHSPSSRPAKCDAGRESSAILRRKQSWDSGVSEFIRQCKKDRLRRRDVIQYNGNIQNRLEQLVQVMGGSRNGLRKGKMEAQLDGLTRCNSSSSDSSGDEGFAAQFGDALNPKRMLPNRKPKFLTLSKNTEIYDRIDGLIDNTQTACEKAAHQLLRDGQCRTEMDLAKSHLNVVQDLIQKELPSLQKKASKSAARRQRSAERLNRENEELQKREQSLKFATLNFAADTGLGADLEADDTDEGDTSDVCVPTLHLPKKPQMQFRNPRIMAAY